MLAADILKALHERHPPNLWAFFAELRVGTGWGPDREGRMDAWAIHYYPSQRNACVAYEVKVRRSDWLRELRQPHKRTNALERSHQFFFAAPPGVVQPEELPEEAGLIEVLNGRPLVIRQALWRPMAWQPILPFLASVARRAASAESHNRQLLERNGRLNRQADDLNQRLRNMVPEKEETSHAAHGH